MKQLDLFFVKYILYGINYWSELDSGISIPYYDFRKDVLRKDLKVILYGAGRVGRNFYKQIQVEGYFKLVDWLDKGYVKYQEQNMPVNAPEAVCGAEYDYIIIGVLYEDLAMRIKEELVSEYGVNPNKIVWLEPISILDKYCEI